MSHQEFVDSILPLSRYETTLILTAFNRIYKIYPDDCGDLCTDHKSDSERKVLYNYSHTMILNTRCCHDYGLKKSLYRHLIDLSEDQYSYDLLSKFANEATNRFISGLLVWCQKTLILGHTKEECSKYLALSLKFQMYAYYHCEYAKIMSSEVVMETMLCSLKYISLHKCGHTLFKTTMSFFLWYYREKLNEKEDVFLPLLPKVLEIAHQFQFNFFLKRTPEDLLVKYRYITCSALICAKRFLVLSKYGHEDVFNYEIHLDSGELLKKSDMNNMFGFESVPFEGVTGRNYRSFQVLLSFMRKLYDENSDCEAALRVLWKTIPDPYLTQSLFFSCFRQSQNLPEFEEAWKWYQNIVWLEREPRREPRTLKHLSRCVIRRALTKSVQLPHGVERLDIPLSLKSYVTLTHFFD